MSFEVGKNIRLAVFGQSHSKAIGISIDGLPAGLELDLKKIQAFMARRAPGHTCGSTPRVETDEFTVLSGIAGGRTCGSPLCVMIENRNCDPSVYRDMADIPRPMHSDYPAWVKYHGFNDAAGGGHFSGRMTAPICFAGAVCAQILEKFGVYAGAHIAGIGTEHDRLFDAVNVDEELLISLGTEDFPVLDRSAGQRMRALIDDAAARGDSLGGIVECAITGVPAGAGDTMFDSLEGQMSRMLFAIPSVKGVEFGSGFRGAELAGSVHNDEFCFDADGSVRTRTNNHGGILGGLATGMPIVFRAAFKPVPSIGLPQKSVDLRLGTEVELTIGGRHDACVVPRAVPAVEAAAMFTICDVLLSERSFYGA